MKKRIFRLLVFLSAAILCGMAGFYAMTANAKSNGAPDPTATAPRPPAAPLETPETCKVNTSIESGKVNLRACLGAACGAVLDILTEGSSLTILADGEYMNVTTQNGITGWLNSKYCKRE